MAGDKITLEVRSRGVTGTRAVKRLRRSGAIPGVVYGSGSEPRPIEVDAAVLRAALTGNHGRNAILHVSVDGGPAVPSVLKDWQLDPVRDVLRHVDLLQIALDKPISAHVSVVLTGESPGVKMGGSLNQTVHHVRVQAIPAEVPSQLTLDVSDLQVGGALRVSDIELPAAVTVLDDPEALVVAVAATRRTSDLDVPSDGDAASAADGAPAAEPEADAADGNAAE